MMKKKIFYLLAGAALTFVAAPMFTSCSEEEGGGNKPQGETPADWSGSDYSADSDASGSLALTWNGVELAGKQVVFNCEDGTNATLVMSGLNVDMGAAIQNLLPWDQPTYSPIPGMKEASVNVELVKGEEEGTYTFESTEEFTTGYTATVKGSVSAANMTVDITAEFTGTNPLSGEWNLAKVVTSSGDDPEKLSPLWIDVDSEVFMYLGKVGSGFLSITLDGSFNEIINTLCGFMGSMVININGLKGVEALVYQLLNGFGLESDGALAVSYMYNLEGTDWTSPLYSQELPANMLRYYYEDGATAKSGTLRIDVDAAQIATLIGGLLSPASKSDPEKTKEIGRRLIEKISPAVEAGIPVKYEISNDEAKIWLDETWMLDVLKVLAELGSDEYALEFLTPELDKLLGAEFTPLILNLLNQLPDAVNYKTGTTAIAVENGEEEVALSGTPSYAKLGLKLVKGQLQPVETPAE